MSTSHNQAVKVCVGLSEILKLAASHGIKTPSVLGDRKGMLELLHDLRRGKQPDCHGPAWRQNIASHLGVDVGSQMIEEVQIVVDRWRWQRTASSALPPNEIRRELEAARTHLQATRAALRRAGAGVAFGDDQPDAPTWPRRRDGGSVAVLLRELELAIANDAGVVIRQARKVDDESLVQLLAGIWSRAGKPHTALFDRRRPFGRFVDDATGEYQVSKEAANRALAAQ